MEKDIDQLQDFKSRALKFNTSLDDRPREKAMKYGFSDLSPAELFAIIIGSGSQGENVVDLCQRLLNDHDNKIYKIARLDYNDLARMYRGVGEVKALQILAAIEIARRFQGEKFDDGFQITDANAAYRYLRTFMLDKNHEEMWMLILDRAKHVKAKVMVSSGGTAATIGDEKIILRQAIVGLASSIILAHNHPSNNPRPSIQDDTLTQRVKKACDAVGIPLDDHIIVCRGDFYSYQAQGKL
ncbi:MAG: DNA repair protein RadC [Muribaculaceae bacterium]|nr:DNA repair protein RadC [Muribaculaceae bacterium]